jgi:hypothetical protein
MNEESDPEACYRRGYVGTTSQTAPAILIVTRNWL